MHFVCIFNNNFVNKCLLGSITECCVIYGKLELRSLPPTRIIFSSSKYGFNEINPGLMQASSYYFADLLIQIRYVAHTLLVPVLIFLFPPLLAVSLVVF